MPRSYEGRDRHDRRDARFDVDHSEEGFFTAGQSSVGGTTAQVCFPTHSIGLA